MSYAQRGPFSHLPSVALVAILHIAIIYALVNGLARTVVEMIKPPMGATIIDDVKKMPLEPPPPQPLKLEAAPPAPYVPSPDFNIEVQPVQDAITSNPPMRAQETTPHVAADPRQPAIRRDYSAAYRVEPQFPRAAISQGLSGRVIAWVQVNAAGEVTNVEIKASSNRVFNGEVVRALSQWRFKPEPTGFIGEYEIVFNLRD